MKKTHNLLWTSGWDSTFRLLQIVLIEKKTVQPIYIKDKNRKSLDHELIAIDKIMNTLFEKYPNSKDLIKPIWFIEKEQLIENKDICNAFKHLSTIRKIGSQYEWLSQFCHTYNLKNIEISIEKNLDLSSFGNFIKKII